MLIMFPFFYRDPPWSPNYTESRHLSEVWCCCNSKLLPRNMVSPWGWKFLSARNGYKIHSWGYLPFV